MLHLITPSSVYVSELSCAQLLFLAVLSKVQECHSSLAADRTDVVTQRRASAHHGEADTLVKKN